MKKQIVDTSKYPIQQSTSRTMGKRCWIKVRKKDGVFYKENMWFTFETVVKDYKKYLMYEKTNQYWRDKPYSTQYEVYECEIVKHKQIIFK